MMLTLLFNTDDHALITVYIYFFVCFLGVIICHSIIVCFFLLFINALVNIDSV